MRTVPFRLVTVVAERLLRDRIIEEVRRLGATGYTLTDVHGEGTSGVNASEWEGPSVKVEAIVPPEVAERIVEHVAQTYFAHHAVIVYTQDVTVVRAEKYGEGNPGEGAPPRR